MNANLDLARRYLAALESGPGLSADFFTPDFVFEELPNASFEQGRKAMSSQRYEIRRAVGDGDLVVLEVLWTGTLAVRFGTMKPGDEMRALSAMFLEIKDGRLAFQRNYDCFEPF